MVKINQVEKVGPWPFLLAVPHMGLTKLKCIECLLFCLALPGRETSQDKSTCNWWRRNLTQGPASKKSKNLLLCIQAEIKAS